MTGNTLPLVILMEMGSVTCWSGRYRRIVVGCTVQGQRFQNSHWGVFSTDVEWMDVRLGDFNGDGRTDIIGRAKARRNFVGGRIDRVEIPQ